MNQWDGWMVGQCQIWPEQPQNGSGGCPLTDGCRGAGVKNLERC